MLPMSGMAFFGEWKRREAEKPLKSRKAIEKLKSRGQVIIAR